MSYHNSDPKPEKQEKKDKIPIWEFRQKYGSKKSFRDISLDEKKPKPRKAKKKRKPIDIAFDKAKSFLQKFWRLDAADKYGCFDCPTCKKKRIRWNDSRRANGCHYTPAHRSKETALMYENGLAACSYCNRYAHQDPQIMKVFAEALDKKHGEGTAERIEKLSKNSTRKYDAFELNEIAKYWKLRCDELKKEKGL